MDCLYAHVNLGFNKKDLYNHIKRHKHSQIKDGDALVALNYVDGTTNNDLMFFLRYLLGCRQQ